MSATHTTRAGSSSTAKQGWATGLTAFAAVMLILVGLLDVFRGIMAVAEDEVFVTTPNYVFQFDLTSWGWIHLILGVIALLIGLGLLKEALWARVAGVVVAGLLIVASFLSLPYAPVWSVVMIALSGFVIWALCVVRSDGHHGGHDHHGDR
jgi:hypothetical protein